VALTDEEQATFDRLSTRLGRDCKRMRRLDAYYEGDRRLDVLGMAVPPGMEAFVTMVNWPRITADAPVQRLLPRGFRIGGAAEADAGLWDIWRANGLEAESTFGHLDAAVMGRGYVVVGSRDPEDAEDGDDDLPLVTVESPLEVTHEFSARSRRTTAALRKGKSEPGTMARAAVEHATLFTPDATIWLERSGTSQGWQEIDRDPHDMGAVLVQPLLNRGRTHQRYGVSEVADIITLTDAACRALTNAQLATEALAVPQKYALGVSESDFIDPKTGETKTAWESYYGAVWGLMNDQAKVGQFSAADLGNFETIVNHYANLVSGSSGLPTRYYGQNTTNPPSEGSIVADEARLIQNAERMQGEYGATWIWAMRAARRIMDGRWDPSLRRLEMLWRNPATPTIAQEADAVVKLFSARDARGRSLLPLRMARERIGMTEADLKRAASFDEDDATTDPVAVGIRGLTDVSGDGPATDVEPEVVQPGAA